MGNIKQFSMAPMITENKAQQPAISKMELFFILLQIILYL